MSATAFRLDEQEAAINAVAVEWAALMTKAVAEWDADMATMMAEQAQLVAKGRWVGGPADLLTVIGRGRRETYHSAILAWLMNPGGRHRLGTNFLRAVLDTCTDAPAVQPDTLPGCASAVEVNGPSSRADIVVGGPGLHLIVEVKVDWVESDDQCQRLFNDHDRPEARFVFLTPRGRVPRSCDDVTRACWAALSFRQVRSTLERLVDGNSDLAADEDAHATLRSYLATLRREFP